MNIAGVDITMEGQINLDSALSFSQRLNRIANCPAWRSHLSTEEMIRHLGKGITPQVWTAQTFARDGAKLIQLIHRLANVVQKKAQSHLAGAISRVLDAQVNRVIQRMFAHRKDAMFDQEQLWLQAIEEVLAESGLDLAVEITPVVQSVMMQGYSKVGTALGQKPKLETNAELSAQSSEIAQKITGIEETTRKRIGNVIRNSVESGAGVAETAANLQSELPAINAARSLTIARTELSNAWTRGSAKAYLESETLTHVSVIGCEAREDNQWQFNGQSTCNYPDLPVAQLEAFLKVGFHPNHTGTLVPSAFR